MSAGETARTSYLAVRTEIIQRMQLRDYVLLAFLGFTGAIFGVALGAPSHIEVLLSIPFLSLGAAILVAQHNFMAAVLGEFLSQELKKNFDELKENAPLWDNSKTFGSFAFRAARFRFVGHILIIFVPSCVSLAANWQIPFSTPLPIGNMWCYVWMFGLVCLFGAVFVIWLSHHYRMAIYYERFKKGRILTSGLHLL